MTWEICVIDDSIPVTGNIEIDDTRCFNAPILELLLNKNTWNEKEVRDLIEELCNNEEVWEISAFRHPSIYLNSLKNNNYKPDIIIFDWEYAVRTDVSQDLLEILQSSFSLIFIYTHVDMRDEVSKEISREKFSEYKERLNLIHKMDEDSVSNLLNKAKEKFESNFSFRFGKTLRNSTSQAIENVLIKLGEYHIDFVKEFLTASETKETEIKELLTERITTNILENKNVLKELSKENKIDDTKIQNLLSILKSKFRDEINSTDFDLSAESAEEIDAEKLKDLWSYRLYYNPSDNIVRKGDIIKKADEDRYFLIVTPNCDLNRFWHKTFGHIILLPLLEINTQAGKIKEYLSLTRKDKEVKDILKDTKATSFCNEPNRYPDGCFVLPFVEYEGIRLCFLVVSRSLTNIEIEPKAIGDNETPKVRNTHLLDYDHWNDYKRIATISEPFLTPIIQRVFDAISGHGAPDYPGIIVDEIKKEFKNIHDQFWS